MTKHNPTLGPGVSIDVNRLLVSRLLLQANSGGGKSWTLRRLLEQTHGACQQIVLDVEGEFHTLREKYDYVLAGKGGDCPADLRSADLLARRLLELNVSAIVDIYELGKQRGPFVARFLSALMSAPRELWHPALIVIDEAHLFCPEKGRGEAESTGAVIDLMTRGRKRGFCGVLATQRISKLNKDAAAEANNKLIGRSALDVDMRRSAEELGLTGREEQQRLRKLEAGQFFAFGPAISSEVVEVRVGPVQTSHPEAGEKAPPPTPPRERIRKVLAELADLPAEAEAEARSATELRARVRELEKQLAAKPSGKVETRTIEKPVIKDADLKRLERVMIDGGKIAMNAIEASQRIAAEVEKFRVAVMSLRAPSAPTTGNSPGNNSRSVVAKPAAMSRSREQTGMPNDGNISLPVGEAATLRALIQFPDGLRREQLTVLTGYKRSTRDAYIARLREKGLVESNGHLLVVATDAGRAAMPDAEPLPTGTDLQRWWFERLPEGESKILEILIESFPECVRRDELDERTGFKRSTRDAYLSRLAAKQLVLDGGRGHVGASPTLFDGAAS